MAVVLGSILVAALPAGVDGTAVLVDGSVPPQPPPQRLPHHPTDDRQPRQLGAPLLPPQVSVTDVNNRIYGRHETVQERGTTGVRFDHCGVEVSTTLCAAMSPVGV